MNLYDEIINKFKNKIIKDGMDEQDLTYIFSKASNDEMEVLTDLYKTFSYWSSTYEDEELICLKNYKVPDKVLQFYKEYNPIGNPMIFGGINLFGLNSIKEYNSTAFPDSYLIKYGLIVIGNTIGGNLICLDLNSIINDEPRVIGVDHTIVYCSEEHGRPEIVARELSDEEIEQLENGTIKEEELTEWLSYENLIKYTPEISKTFSEFLFDLANEDSKFEDIESSYFSE